MEGKGELRGRPGRRGRGRPGTRREVGRWVLGKGPQHYLFAPAAGKTGPIEQKIATSFTKLAITAANMATAAAVGSRRQPSPQQQARQEEQQVQQEAKAKDRKHRHRWEEQEQQRQQRQQRLSSAIAAERQGTRSQSAHTSWRLVASAARSGTCRRLAARGTRKLQPLQVWTRLVSGWLAYHVGFAQTPRAMPPSFCRTAPNAPRAARNG